MTLGDPSHFILLLWFGIMYFWGPEERPWGCHAGGCERANARIADQRPCGLLDPQPCQVGAPIGSMRNLKVEPHGRVGERSRNRVLACMLDLFEERLYSTDPLNCFQFWPLPLSIRPVKRIELGSTHCCGTRLSGPGNSFRYRHEAVFRLSENSILPDLL